MAVEDVTLDDIRGELDKYFKPPDLTGCFTVPSLMKEYGLGRQRIRNIIEQLLDENKIEFVGQGVEDSAYYYRFIEDDDDIPTPAD